MTYNPDWGTSGGLPDGNYGDVTVSGGGTVIEINSGAVDTAKMGGDVTTVGKALLTAADVAAQRTALGLGALAVLSSVDLAANVTGNLPLSNIAPASAASRLLGRGSASGAGDWEEITIGSGLSLTGTVLSASGGAGGDASMLFGAITGSTNSSNTVYAAVAGSTVTVEAGKTYHIRWLLRTWSAAATTAPRPRRILAGGAVGTVYGFHYVGQSNASAAMLQSSREGTNDPFLATGNATSSTTASGSMQVECLFGCTTGGTIGLEFLSEVNASLVTISGDGSFWVATVRTT